MCVLAQFLVLPLQMGRALSYDLDLFAHVNDSPWKLGRHKDVPYIDVEIVDISNVSRMTSAVLNSS
jgi:hypothetical protein